MAQRKSSKHKAKKTRISASFFYYCEVAGRIVSELGNGSFAQPLKLTAGGVNYGNLTAEQQKALDNYVKNLGLPPGPPTQQGIYASPEFTGDPYPSEVIKPVEENQEPPEGWPRNPIFNAPGDVPGLPVQFGPPVEPATVKPGEGFTGIGLPENDIFYFHPDHLGSTSYITSRNGSISQFVCYTAFGEILFEEHTGSSSSNHLFNGKELDRETNLTYMSARYLDMKTSLWLSSDKYSENDLSVGSYVYSFNNPIRFVDPDGNWPEPIGPPITLFSLYFKVKDFFSGSSGSSRNSSNGRGGTGSGSDHGGIMFANPKGGSSGPTDLIRNGGRQGSDIPWVDASGLVQAGSFATSYRDGLKYKGGLKNMLKGTKEVLKGLKIGNKIGDKLVGNYSSNSSSNNENDSSSGSSVNSGKVSVDVYDTSIIMDAYGDPGNPVLFQRTKSTDLKVDVPNNKKSIDSVKKVYEKKEKTLRNKVNSQWD